MSSCPSVCIATPSHSQKSRSLFIHLLLNFSKLFNHNLSLFDQHILSGTYVVFFDVAGNNNERFATTEYLDLYVLSQNQLERIVALIKLIK